MSLTLFQVDRTILQHGPGPVLLEQAVTWFRAGLRWERRLVINVPGDLTYDHEPSMARRMAGDTEQSQSRGLRSIQNSRQRATCRQCWDGSAHWDGGLGRRLQNQRDDDEGNADQDLHDQEEPHEEGQAVIARYALRHGCCLRVRRLAGSNASRRYEDAVRQSPAAPLRLVRVLACKQEHGSSVRDTAALGKVQQSGKPGGGGGGGGGRGEVSHNTAQRHHAVQM